MMEHGRVPQAREGGRRAKGEQVPTIVRKKGQAVRPLRTSSLRRAHTYTIMNASDDPINGGAEMTARDEQHCEARTAVAIALL